jgi:hypothetical protein
MLQRLLHNSPRLALPPGDAAQAVAQRQHRGGFSADAPMRIQALRAGLDRLCAIVPPTIHAVVGVRCR